MRTTADKTAVVVGGSANYGAAAASALAGRGAHVVLIDEDLPSAGVGNGVETMAVALEDVGAIRDAIDHVGEARKGINILVNSAVESGPDGFWDVTERDWDRCIDVNMKLPFFALQACVPHMRSVGGGRVVNYSSVLGAMTDGSHQLVLGFAKAGVTSMTRQWSVDLCLENIQANSIWVGFDESGRLPAPDDVAAITVFLGLDATPFLNGTHIPVDGGRALLRQGALLT